jgi:hypothetical protein
MAEQDRETTVVHTGGGGAGWFVAILLLVIVAAGGFWLYGGSFSDDKDVSIIIDVPDEVIPDAPAEGN